MFQVPSHPNAISIMWSPLHFHINSQGWRGESNFLEKSTRAFKRLALRSFFLLKFLSSPYPSQSPYLSRPFGLLWIKPLNFPSVLPLLEYLPILSSLLHIRPAISRPPNPPNTGTTLQVTDILDPPPHVTAYDLLSPPSFS